MKAVEIAGAKACWAFLVGHGKNFGPYPKDEGN